MKKVVAYFGIEDKDLVFYPHDRRECEVFEGAYVRYLGADNSTDAKEEAQILAKELDVDSFVIPKWFDGQVIHHQKPEHISPYEDEEGNPISFEEVCPNYAESKDI